MTEKEKIYLAEEKGRKAAMYIFNTKILPDGYEAFPSEDMLCHDITIKNKDGKTAAVVEVKYRNVSSVQYSDAILTDDKYESLYKYVKVPKFFISIYSDGRYYIWKLGECIPTKSKMWCPASTVEDRHKKYKTAYHFKYYDAKYTGVIKQSV